MNHEALEARVAGMIGVVLALGLAAAAGEPPAAPAASSWSTCAPGEVEEQSDCVVMPVVLENVKPVYPKKAKKKRIEGKVIVQAVINKDGSVTSPKILSIQPEGYGFEEAAIKAVTKRTYRPARQHGKPVAIYFTIRVDFRLR